MVKTEDLMDLVFFMRVPLVDELMQFAEIIYEKNYAPRMNIFEQGSTDAKMYVIKKGLVHIVIPKGDQEEVVATFADGDFFGEMSIFDVQPRSATARTAKDTTVFEFSKSDFDQFVEEKPEIGAKILYGMMEDMVRRLRKMTLPADAPMF